ncbi:hypothetical protein KL930_002763 [Ogataea haglerorum]|uniref:Uncharacterized protein n=1 Tax=Ogataea haglerorum TaxID=1937702 RepID=A0AAN6I1C3_9ASCO|nr:uncharacterized protein KL911_002979 [Ogataea haglerorum]KAG7691852.1 hypothetical protein KL915_004915 [Ogataea haglerorum]KAG7702933.1 hypothetical protein KL950_005011 [Ogataea haglerorum]KAG7703032.1 hypothetical protein KL914_005037 [Ogataea haglerorum]KAG7718919.1 hypothetical protein KL913_001917 [Ogataea haglerorum]KAG7720256.1 hypothetical protein KL949_002221 [Ogataea haglerorum]
MSQITVNGSRLLDGKSNFNLLANDTIQSQYNNNNHKYGKLYELAIKLYLNRNFEKAWSLISPIVENLPEAHNDGTEIERPLLVKIFKLYLSLIDLKLKRETRDSHDFLNSEYSKRLQQGVLFIQIRNIYNEEYDRIDPELLLLCFIVELSNGFPLIELRAQLELYLTFNGILSNETKQTMRSSGMMRIAEFYLLHILPKFNEFRRSEKLINRIFAEDDYRRDHCLSILNQIVTSYKAGDKKVPSSTDFNEQRLKTRRRKHGKRIQEHVDDNSPMIADDNNGIYRFLKNALSTHQLRGLKKVVIRGTFLIFILGIIIGSCQMYSRIRGRLLWFFMKVRQTLGMALKITYI